MEVYAFLWSIANLKGCPPSKRCANNQFGWEMAPFQPDTTHGLQTKDNNGRRTFYTFDLFTKQWNLVVLPMLCG
jgi:hypothetical protein